MSRNESTDSPNDPEDPVRTIIDLIPILAWTACADGSVDFVNRCWLDYTGIPENDALDRAWTSSIHPDDRGSIMDQWKAQLISGEPGEGEARLRRHDGEYRWFVIRSNSQRDGFGKILKWYGTNTDIEDRRRAEEALRSAQARLARATNLAAMSALSAAIAHEMNQPLSAVLANGHACQRWLAAEPPNVGRARLSAERIIRDGNSAAEVIQRICALSRHAPPKKSFLDLNEVIDEVCDLLSAQIRTRNIVLEVDLESDLPQVSADRVQMQQVLASLAHNGIEAMEAVEGRPKCMKIRSRARSDEIVIEVRDHGVGLKDPETVFEPFHTTKESGMGMGLAICRSIIEAHGGRLWASQNAPHGAAFGFALRIGEEV